jgi:hypothetical protein
MHHCAVGHETVNELAVFGGCHTDHDAPLACAAHTAETHTDTDSATAPRTGVVRKHPQIGPTTSRP